jgi:hypothetical protein
MTLHRWVRAMLSAGLAVALTAGCTTFTRHECWREAPVAIRLRVVRADGGAAPARITVRGLESAVLPDAGGRAVFTIPAVSGGRTYVDGVLVREEDPQQMPAVWVWLAEWDRHPLSLVELDALPLDADGYRVLDLDA